MKTKKITLYLDNRLHFAIDTFTKFNKFIDYKEADTINKNLSIQLERFCDKYEKATSEDFVALLERTMSIDKETLKNNISLDRKNYPFEIPTSLKERSDTLHTKLCKSVGYKIPKVTYYNIIWLNYIQRNKADYLEKLRDFLYQPFLSANIPFEEKVDIHPYTKDIIDQFRKILSEVNEPSQ